METRKKICQSASQKLAAAQPGKIHALLGFDGFIDEIVDVVDKRESAQSYSAIPTIAHFGERITLAAGKSCNLELVVREKRRGGNGPIMADAIASLGLAVTYIGNVGEPIDPAFSELQSRASVISVGPAAKTSALEFSDGKVMMGNLGPLTDMTWDRIVSAVGLERLFSLFDAADLIGMVNWTMLPFMTSIWQGVHREILPRLSKKPRRVFIDLADPEKRLPADISLALEVLKQINLLLPVTLGLNLSEAMQVSRVLELASGPAKDGEAIHLAEQIQKKLQLDTVVVHPRTGAAAARTGEIASFLGPYVEHPKISTGAGDHFNGGFSVAQLLGMSLEEALATGTATSGYYVRHAASATQEQLVAFLQELPPPQIGA